MLKHTALLIIVAATSVAHADFRYRAVSATRWGMSDRTLGVANCTIEDFESVTLATGIQVHVTSGSGSYGPTSTLPSRYTTSVDPNGSAFLNSQWSGTAALINTFTNQTLPYTNANNWGDVELVFDPPVKIVGFSMYNRDAGARLVINGVDRGELGALTGLPTSSTRGGFAVVFASGTDSISTLKIDNNNGDGFVIDHVAYSTIADPAVTVSGFSTWNASDASMGCQRAAIESFETVSLNPRLQVQWEAPAGTVGPTSVLPTLFDPFANDPFGTAFRTGAWDGTHGIVTGRGNQSWNYQDGTNWGDVEFYFDPPLALVGMSIEQMDSEGRLIVNGRDIGGISELSGLPINSGRQGYLKIESPSQATISSVRFANRRTGTTGDGYMIDHLGMRGCGSDFNDDAVVDFFDYLDFVAAFAGNESAADFNGDGVIDFFDYLDFVAAFSQGC